MTNLNGGIDIFDPSNYKLANCGSGLTISAGLNAMHIGSNYGII